MANVNLFGARRGGIKPEDKNLNQLIFDVAEHQRANDIEEIYRRLSGLELFAPVLSANFGLKDGQKAVIERGMELRIATTQIQGLAFAAFLVNKADPRLGENFIGMSVVEAFDMIEKNRSFGWAGFLQRPRVLFRHRTPGLSQSQKSHPVLKQNHKIGRQKSPQHFCCGPFCKSV